MQRVARPLKWPPVFPVNKDLEAWFPFDERSGSVLKDRSGKGRDGVITGGTWGAGSRGSSLLFNGSSDLVTINHVSALAPSVISFGTWLLLTSDVTSGNQSAISKESNDGKTGYDLRIIPTNQIRVAGGTGSDADEWDTGVTITSGAWHHVFVVWNGAVKYLYVNGLLQAQHTVAGPASNTLDLLLGRFANANVYYFAGRMKDTRFYSRALTSAEVNRLYESELPLVRY